MNILILQDYLRSGGTERQSILLGRAFAAAGHATALVTFRPGGALRGTARSLDLRLPPAVRPWAGLVRPGARARGAGPGSGHRARDGAHGQLPRRAAAADPRPARAPGAVVGTLRTGKPLPWLFRRSLQAVRHIVANSEEARERLTLREGLPAEKITVIANALVFPPRAPAPAGPLRARLGAGPRTTVLVCVAMFRPEKNQRELVEIAAGLPREGPAGDWQLWLAGDGPARSACERLARERGIQDRVKFPGFLPDPGELYGAADLAVHASRSESLSNFLIEAQVHGLPAVAYAAQGVGECFDTRSDRLGDPGRRPGRLSGRPGSAARRAASGPGRPRRSRPPVRARSLRSGPPGPGLPRAFRAAGPLRAPPVCLPAGLRPSVRRDQAAFPVRARRPIHPHPGRPAKQPEGHRPGSAAGPLHRGHGPERRGQKFAGLRYPPRRGPAALRRDLQRLYAPVSRPARQARVDSIENIRPSIAIEQSNTVKTSRSTVGTMTELTDYFKVWFSHAAACFDPDTGEPVEDDTPATIWAKTQAAHAGGLRDRGLPGGRPANLAWSEILASLKAQGYTRLLSSATRPRPARPCWPSGSTTAWPPAPEQTSARPTSS